MEQRKQFILVILAAAMSLAGGERALAQGDSWARIADMPTPRRLLAAATDGTNLYTFGGCGSPCFGPPFHTSTDEETKVEVYLPQQKRWVEKRRMPTILFGAAAAAPGNGKIYTFGGYISGNVVQEYDPANDSWTLKAPMPTPRFGLTAVALGRKVYVLGGSDGQRPIAALEVYDPDTDNWTSGPSMPTARVFLAAAALDGKIYVVGGSPDADGKAQTDAVEIFDPAKNSWTVGARLPIARQVSAAVSVEDKIYVFGGFIPGSGVQADTFEYDLKRRTWEFRAPMPVARDQAPAVLIGSKAIVVGGSIDCHCKALSRSDEYTPGIPSLTCKKVGTTLVAPGGTATYTIDIRNDGTKEAVGVTLEDPTPEGLELMGVEGDCTALPCSLGTVEANKAKQVKVTFRVPADYEGDDPFTNEATVLMDGETQDTCDADTSLLKVVCEKSEPARDGELIVYTLTARNDGGAEATDVILDDPAPLGLELAEVGSPCGALPCSLGTLDPHESVAVAVKFRRLEGCWDSVSNIASVTAGGGAKHECSSPVPEEADLAVKVDAPSSVLGDIESEIPVRVSNTGPNKAMDVMLTVDFEGASSVESEDCEESPPGHFICTLGDIVCGTEKVLKFHVEAPACLGTPPVPSPPIELRAEVESTTFDPNPLNDLASLAVKVDSVCLVVTKTDAPDPVGIGEELNYTITVKNVGTLDALKVKVKDIPPPPELLADLRWCEEDKDCPPNNPGPIDTEVDIPAGNSKVFRMRGTVGPICGPLIDNFPVCGPLSNTVTATHPLAKDEDEAATAVAVTQVEGIALLCTQIDGASTEGSMITKIFKLINCGPAIQMDNPGDELTDTLPAASLTLVSASADSGTTATGANTATWNGSLDVGQIVTIKITASVNFGTAGTDICNQATGSFDLDEDGINETILLSDDLDRPGEADPCCFHVPSVAPEVIPTLSEIAAVALVLLLAALALRRLRLPSAGR